MSAIADYLAQSTGQVTAINLLSALVALFIVATIVGAFRHPSGPGLINLAVLVSAIYLGWAAARWPGVTYSEGMILGIWHMWLDSVRTVWNVFWDISGLDSVATRIGASKG